MRKIKLYEADDKMIDLITDNYSMLQGLNAFGKVNSNYKSK